MRKKEIENLIKENIKDTAFLPFIAKEVYEFNKSYNIED